MRLIGLLKRDLAKETINWVNDGIISSDQASSICQRYGIDFHNQQTNSFGYHVLIILGYLFIALSLITLIGANWDEIPRGLRMAAVITTTLFFNLLGVLQFKKDKLNAAVRWFFLGGLCYGAAIMLIAQIYHIGEHFPDGIFWWALGILPLALLLRSTLLMLLTAVLAFTWFFVESSLEYFPLFFPVFLAAIGWHIFKLKHSIVLFLILVLGIGLLFEYSLSWTLGNPWRFSFSEELVILIGALFILYYGIAKWLYHRSDPHLRDYGAILGIWSLRFAIIAMFILSFEEPWKELMRNDWDNKNTALIISLLFSTAAIGAAFIGTRSILKTMSTFSFALFYFIGLLGMMYAPTSYSEYLQIFANLVLIIAGIWLIAQGIHEGATHYFYFGVLTIMVTGLLRYIDFVGDYIGAAILFAVFAGILLGVARYWRGHLQKPEASE